MTEVINKIDRRFEQKIYKFTTILVFDKLGSLHAWSLAQSMGSIKTQYKWSYYDAHFVDFDLRRDL